MLFRSGPNKCTVPQITEFKTKCLGSGATGCDAFIDTNKDCSRCIFGALKGDTPDTTPIPALLPVSDKSVTLNVQACAALAIGKPECAVPLAQELVCVESACSTCTVAADATKCNQEAAADICKDVVAAAKACNTAITAARAQWTPICTEGTTFETTYPKLVNYLCGTGGPSVDGGSTDAGGGG